VTLSKAEDPQRLAHATQAHDDARTTEANATRRLLATLSSSLRDCLSLHLRSLNSLLIQPSHYRCLSLRLCSNIGYGTRAVVSLLSLTLQLPLLSTY